MAKLHCLTDQYSKKVLVKDYGDSTKYAVLHISKTDVFIKIDKRIKSKEDFIKLYGYNSVHTEEEHINAILWNPK